VRGALLREVYLKCIVYRTRANGGGEECTMLRSLNNSRSIKSSIVSPIRPTYNVS